MITSLRNEVGKLVPVVFFYLLLIKSGRGKNFIDRQGRGGGRKRGLIVGLNAFMNDFGLPVDCRWIMENQYRIIRQVVENRRGWFGRLIAEKRKEKLSSGKSLAVLNPLIDFRCFFRLTSRAVQPFAEAGCESCVWRPGPWR